MIDKQTMASLRRSYHQSIARNSLGWRGQIPNCAAKNNKVSAELAKALVQRLGLEILTTEPNAQRVEPFFAAATHEFLHGAVGISLHRLLTYDDSFIEYGKHHLAYFEQYQHLTHYSDLLERYIVMGGYCLDDHSINEDEDALVIAENDRTIAKYTPLRRVNGDCPAILLAAISCRWLIDDDSVQALRTEAQYMIRNRKGSTPKIMLQTMDPQPTHIALAGLGTGDIDCTYHVALHELAEVVDASKHEAEKQALAALIEGRRLRDVSDLPFDLIA